MIEEKKNSNKKVLSIVIVLMLLVIVIGASFALWTNVFTGSDNVIGSEDMSIEYLESSDVIDITNALPMSEAQGKAQEDKFDFEVTTRTGSNMNIGYSLVLDKLEADEGYDLLNDSDIRLYLTDEEGAELALYNINAIDDNYVIYSDVNIHNSENSEIVDRYSLRVWIDEQVDASDWNADTKLQYKFRINVEASETNNLDISGANHPVLTGIENAQVSGSSIIPLADEVEVTKSNMIPVYYDTADSKWKKADETNTVGAYKWYDYNKKMWANSVTVTADSRETYQNAPLGTEINIEDDVLTMQVWIPRYKYKVWNYNLDGTVGSEPQTIQIVFEDGTESTGQISCEDNVQGTSDGTATGEEPINSETCKVIETSAECTDETCNGKTYTHPAFTFGENELSGFWVGKFENVSDSACEPTNIVAVNAEGTCNVDSIRPLVKPNRTSWRGAMVSVFENNMMTMNEDGNKYGFDETNDTHMMKNIEWGAVAYLSLSKYGKNAELEMNTNSEYKTGCGPTAKGNTTKTTECSAYTTELGQASSTTGNIYGIYDMSGGAWEYLMGNVVSADGSTMLTGYSASGNYHSGYTGKIGTSSFTGAYAYPDAKYYDKYSYATTFSNSAARSRSKLGDAVREVYNTGNYGWYDDFNYVAGLTGSWFVRGGDPGSESSAGLLASIYDSGCARTYISSRVVLAALTS